MRDENLVSVIIPNYNHAQFLKERIDTVLNQSYRNFEVIILDDCSTDNSKAIIESYRYEPRVKQVVYNEKNSGSPFKQWIKGVALAQGQYIWIAESDDFSETKFLETLVNSMKKGMTLAYCQSKDVDYRGKVIENRIKWTDEFSPNIWKNDFAMKGNSFLDYLKVKNVIPNSSSCLINASSLREILENDLDVLSFKYCGDWYLWIELCKLKNSEIFFCSEPINYYRVSRSSTRHFNSIQKKQLRLTEELRIVNRNRKLYSDLELTNRYEKIKKKWFSFHNKSNFGRAFFTISPLIRVNPIILFFDFIFFKCKKN